MLVPNQQQTMHYLSKKMQTMHTEIMDEVAHKVIDMCQEQGMSMNVKQQHLQSHLYRTWERTNLMSLSSRSLLWRKLRKFVYYQWEYQDNNSYYQRRWHVQIKGSPQVSVTSNLQENVWVTGHVTWYKINSLNKNHQLPYQLIFVASWFSIRISQWFCFQQKVVHKRQKYT
jgi:hypothetical protein